MGKVIRSLLVAGNEKLAPTVTHFDLPAGIACPGKSQLCYTRCYARKNRFAFPQGNCAATGVTARWPFFLHLGRFTQPAALLCPGGRAGCAATSELENMHVN